MARYTGPVCRLCRRAGEKLFLKGERCFTPKCAVERRQTVPGGSSTGRRRRTSTWGLQLREKQKARQTYGVLERQFRKYYEQARSSPGITGDSLLQLLESRMDNVIFRTGFAESRSQARQLVNHGHFLVNGRRMDIPSYLTQPGDEITWKESSKKNEHFLSIRDGGTKRTPPSWLTLDNTTMTARIQVAPDAKEIDTRVDTRLIVEHYAR